MKKLTKKNNKGFSLVELIVVVLIMAIIAVALAPQVTKWVNNSRIATDRQTKDSIVSAFQVAATNASCHGKTAYIKVENTKAAWGGTDEGIVQPIVDAIYKASDARTKTTGDFTVTLNTDGSVTVTDNLPTSGDLK